MFATTQPLRKVRPSKPRQAAANDLAPPVRPADRIDADVVGAVRTFLPSAHKVEDFPSLPAINLKTHKFRKDRRRVVSMPIFSQSPIWAEEDPRAKRNLGSAVPASVGSGTREKWGVRFAEDSKAEKSARHGKQEKAEQNASLPEKNSPVVEKTSSLVEQKSHQQSSAVIQQESHPFKHTISKPEEISLKHVSAPPRMVDELVINYSGLNLSNTSTNVASPDAPRIITQFNSSYNITSSDLLSALDRLKMLNLNTYERILRCYMRSSLESFSSSSTMPSNVSSNALDDVFDCASSIYPSEDEMSQHDTLFEDLDNVKQPQQYSPLPVAPIMSVKPPPVSQMHAVPRSEVRAPSTQKKSQQQPFSYTLDMGAEYDKSRFMIPKENRIQVAKTRLPLASKRLPSVPVDGCHAKEAPNRYSSGPMWKVKRLFSAH